MFETPGRILHVFCRKKVEVNTAEKAEGCFPNGKKQDKMRRLIRKAFFLHLQVLRKEDNLTCPEEDFDKYSDEEFDPPTGPFAFNSPLIDDKEDQIPFEYRHIRSGPRSVRLEYYILVHKLKSELHMSERQAQGAIVAVANILFGRKDLGEWKLYEKNKVADVNNLPAPSNINRTEQCAEAMVLAGIACHQTLRIHIPKRWLIKITCW